DRAPLGAGEIDPEMGLARLALEDALAAIDAGDPAFRRTLEAVPEPGRVRIPPPCFGDLGVLTLDAGDDLGVGCHHLLRQAIDPLHVIFALPDLKLACLLGARGKADLQDRLGSCLMAETKDEATPA